MKILQNKNIKILKSENCNYYFNKKTGFMATWGKTKEDDPTHSPFGPFIVDIEISTICAGVPNKSNITIPCSFCYKSNTSKGTNMKFETFKKIIDMLCPVVTQVALGSGATVEENPDTWKMMEYALSKGVIPNITVANVNFETAKKLSSYCGAVAVSRYSNKNICYDTIQRLHDAGLKQINIHQMISENSYNDAMETLHDMKIDKRLEHVNAVVLLSLKKVGRGQDFTQLSNDKFKNLVDFAIDNNIGVGFDSCGAHKFLLSVKDRKNYKELESLTEPCESFGMFSSYFNVDGNFYPCSFLEEVGPWKNGKNIHDCVDFVKEVWNSELLNKYRKMSINNCRKCLFYDV